MGDGPGAQRLSRRNSATKAFGGLALGSAVLALGLAWYQLFQSLDFADESGSLVVPWRWALGDMPFVNEEDLSQIPSLLVYPLVKLFAVLRDYDVTGLILYGRHLYLLLAVGVALGAFMVLRRLLRWELALLVAALCVASLSWDTPQVSSSTMGAALLTLGSILGLRAVIEPPSRGWALASGVVLGLAVVAYPTLLFVLPFYSVFLAFALGRGGVALLAEGAFEYPPDPQGPPTGRMAWQVLSAWALGGALALVPISLVVLSFGAENLERCWHYTLETGHQLGQLGGATKAYEIVSGSWSFLWSRPYLVVIAVLIYVAYRRWPPLGRSLLAGLPVALWLAGQRPALGTAGFVLMYAAAAPYLYLFIPRERRPDGARILIWIWVPALFAGAMAAYTSSLGYVHAAMGLFPAILASALFLAWALEAVPRPGVRLPWLSLAVLLAVLGVAVSFQFRQQAGPVSAKATTRFGDGPWWGVRVPESEHAYVTRLSTDLAAHERMGDKLLVFYGGSGLYLYWSGGVATNSYWIRTPEQGSASALPQSTIDYYRRHEDVPTLVVHFLATAGLEPEELSAACGGLDYAPVLVRPTYVVHRMPESETVDDVLDRLPR